MNYTIKVNLAPELDVNKFNSIISLMKSSFGAFSKEFKPIDVTEFNKEMSKYKTVANEGFSVYNDGVEAATTKTKKFKNEITGISKLANFSLAFQGLNQLTSILDSFSTDYKGLDTATQKIKTLGGEATKIAPDLREMAISLSKEIPISNVDIATASYEALSAGIKANTEDMQAFMTSASKLAVGGSESVASTVNMLSSLVNAYGLEAKEVNRISDEIFMTVNLGKTSVAEMNHSLAQVIPTASAYGVSFKYVGGSMAYMTAQGIPTAQSATKLNALFIEMQKPGAELTKILGSAGISVEEMGKKVKDGKIVEVLEEMRDAFNKAGVSATQAFSSSEASAAFNSLTNDIGGLKDVMKEFDNSAGSTDFAFNQMTESVGSKMQMLKNKISNLFVGFNDMVGNGFTLIVGAGKELMPVITSIQGIGAIFPEGTISNIKSYASLMLNTLVPGLIATDIETKKTIINTEALSISNLKAGASALYSSAMSKADAIGKGIQLGATTLLTAAQTGLNAAFIASPIGWIVVAVAALAGAMYLLYKNVEPVRIAFDTAFNFIKAAISGAWEVIKSFGNILFGIGKLVIDVIITPFQIAWSVVENVGSALGGWIGSLFGISNETKEAVTQFNIINDTVKYLKDVFDYITFSIKAMTDGIASFAQSTISIISDIFTLDFGGAAETFNNAGKEAGSAFTNSMQKQLMDKNWNESAESIKQALNDATKINKENLATSGLNQSLSDYTNKITAASKLFNEGFSSQSQVIEKQKKQLESLKIEIDKTNDKTKKEQLLKLYNEELAKINTNKEALTKSFIEGGKAGLVTEQSINKISSALNITNQKARELLVDEALKNSLKSGDLTEKQLKSISVQYGVNIDRVKELYSNQKKITEETKKTEQAAKSWGDILSDTDKKQKEARDEIAKQLLLKKQGAKFDQEVIDKNAKDFKEASKQKAVYNEIENEMNRLGFSLDNKKSETQTKITKEKKSQYEIALNQFNLIQDEAKFQNEIFLERIKNESLISGVKQSNIEIDKQNIQLAKLDLTELERKRLAYFKVVEAADKQFNIEKAKGKISENTLKNYNEAKKTLQGIDLELLKADNKVKELDINLKINEGKLTEDLNRLKEERERESLEFQIKLGYKNEVDKINFDIKQLQNEIDNFVGVINISANQDEILKAQNSIDSNIDKIQLLTLQKNEILQVEILSQNTDFAERDYNISLFYLEKQLKESLIKAGNNYQLQQIAYQEFYNKKREITEKFYNESEKLEIRAFTLMRNFSETFANSVMNNTIKPINDAINNLQSKIDKFNDSSKREADLSAIEEEEKALIESFKRREVSAKEYQDKLQSINKKRIDSGTLNESAGSRALVNLQIGTAKAFESIHLSLLKSAQQSSLNLSKNFQQIQELQKQNTAESAGKIKDIYADNNEQIKNFALNAVGSSIAGFTALLAAGEDFGTAFRKGFVANLLETVQQAILVNIAGIYSQYFMQMGIWGLPAATAAITIVYGALEVAKSAIGRKAGEVDLQGRGTSTSDDNLRLLSVGESVLTANATKRNKDLFKWLNVTGGSAIDYFSNVSPISELNIDKHYAIILASKKEDDSRKNDYYLLKLELQKLNRNLDKKPLNTRVQSGVDLSINLDKNRMIKSVEVEKMKRLRRF